LRTLLALVFGTLILSIGATMAHAGRGRPIIKNHTVMTDNGDPIRGVFFWSSLTRDSFRAIKSQGFNALHVYAETFNDGTPGGNVAWIDQLVQWANEDGVYLIITIGNGSNNGQYDWNYAMAFWNVYAQRYKDDPWVIYELQNEPSWNTKYDTQTMSFEQTGYNTIRSSAPNSMILLFSVMLFSNGSGIASNCRSLKGVDWSKTAVAFHGYAGDGATMGAFAALSSAGFPSICTEFSNLGADTSMDGTELKDFENAGVSWACFLNAVDDYHYYNPVGNTRWIPDYGSYPLPAPTNGVVLNGRYLIQAAGWNYLRSDLNQGGQLDAVASTPGAWEQFQISDAGNGYVSLKSVANSKQVTCVKDGNTNPLQAKTDWVQDWEKYLIVPAGNGQYNIIARSCAQYVTCRRDNNGAVQANQPTPYTWEAFTITPLAPVGHCIAIYSPAAGKYLTANMLDSHRYVQAIWATSIGTWEKFDVYDAGSGLVGLKAVANNLYVSTNLNPGGGNDLQAGWATSIGTWEQYKWNAIGGNNFTLQSPGAGYYVSVDLIDPSTGGICRAAWAQQPQYWETFTYTDLGAWQ